MRRMKLLIVDNEIEHIATVREVLRGTKLFDARTVSSYKHLGDEEDRILAAVEPYDLLILDVYENDKGAGFKRLVNVVAGHKPFLAYTWSERHAPFELSDDQVTV